MYLLYIVAFTKGLSLTVRPTLDRNYRLEQMDKLSHSRELILVIQ